MLPAAGDIRSEFRFLAPIVAEKGYRVVTADLPGHGESPGADSYGVEESAAAIADLIERTQPVPATVVGASFSPAAAVWAATSHPQLVRAVVAISPHLESEASLRSAVQRWSTLSLLRGPWAGRLWARLYRSWYMERIPADLDAEIAKLKRMMDDPVRRRAVRLTLTAHREGMAERMGRLTVPSLVVFGTADNHFPDPAAEARHLSQVMRAESVMVEGAGHYPHVEQPVLVGQSIVEFLSGSP